MKKISLVVFPALTIVLEALPMGAVCTFAISPTERVRETFSYFSLIPFGYANFAPLITAILTVVANKTIMVVPKPLIGQTASEFLWKQEKHLPMRRSVSYTHLTLPTKA